MNIATLQVIWFCILLLVIFRADIIWLLTAYRVIFPLLA